MFTIMGITIIQLKINQEYTKNIFLHKIFKKNPTISENYNDSN
jgi:hypothetical protein